MIYEHPWGTQAHALAKPLLPASIRNLFDTDIVPDSDNLVDQPSMQAPAMGGKFAFLVGKASFRSKISLAVLPDELTPAPLLAAPFFVIVLRVIGTALSVQLAL